MVHFPSYYGAIVNHR